MLYVSFISGVLEAISNALLRVASQALPIVTEFHMDLEGVPATWLTAKPFALPIICTMIMDETRLSYQGEETDVKVVCSIFNEQTSATGSPITWSGRKDTETLRDSIASTWPLCYLYSLSSRGKQRSCSSEAPSQSPAWPPLSRAVMAELTPAWKGHRLYSPVARTPVPGIHGCQAKACSEQVAKSFVASSIAHTCWQSHSAADHANLANACTMLSSSSTFAIGSLIKQIGGNDIKTSWDKTAFTLPFNSCTVSLA